tara:strand:- start:13105 stop:13800 length:696 start_codon:yes stop_codon:yes gene_type:complete
MFFILLAIEYMFYRTHVSHKYNVSKVGNHFFYPITYTDTKPIIYSFGVGTNVDFDKSISKLYACKVYMYDPTPVAKKFMSSVKDNLLIFHSYGIWIKNKIVKFFFDKNKKFDGKKNMSITNLFNTDSFLEFQCYTLETIMKKNDHSTVNILKLDIEGSAISVMEHMLFSKIFPDQIIVEFETPSALFGNKSRDILLFYKKRKKIFKNCLLFGYKLIHHQEFNYLFVKKDLL